MSQPEDSLLDQLKHTSDPSLGEGVRQVDRFTEEEEEKHKRGIRSETRATVAKLKRLFLWLLFGIVSFLAIALAVGFVVLVVLYVATFAHDPNKLGTFLGSVGVWVLIALATLFVERIVPDKD